MNLKLQANCSAKIVEKFCKELNFNPPEKKVGENANIVTIEEIIKCLKNSSAKKEPEVENKKKRKISESSSSSSDSEEETFTPKRAKIDLSITECYKCHKTGHMSRKKILAYFRFFVGLFWNFFKNRGQY